MNFTYTVELLNQSWVVLSSTGRFVDAFFTEQEAIAFAEDLNNA